MEVVVKFKKCYNYMYMIQSGRLNITMNCTLSGRLVSVEAIIPTTSINTQNSKR